jgi:hypothetical protein
MNVDMPTVGLKGANLRKSGASDTRDGQISRQVSVNVMAMKKAPFGEPFLLRLA